MLDDKDTAAIMQRYHQQARETLFKIAIENPSVLPQALISIQLNRLMLRSLIELITAVEKGFQLLEDDIGHTLKPQV